MTTGIAVEQIDHVHVGVADRDVAEAWYGRVLGLSRDPDFASWAELQGAPLVLRTAVGRTSIALFKRNGRPSGQARTIAFRVAAEQFARLVASLDGDLMDLDGNALTVASVVDHGLCVSIYLADPDGNPIELVTFDAKTARNALRLRDN